MKLLVILAFIGFAAAVPVAEEISWENSIYNWYKDDKDVRGPHMKCVESQVKHAVQEKKGDFDSVNAWYKDWKAEIKSKTVDEIIVKLREDMPIFKKHLKNLYGVLDEALTECRGDNKFSFIEFINKYFDLFVELDDSYIKRVVSEFYNDSEERAHENEKEAICYKDSVSTLKECAKEFFNFQVYEEKGICGINYFKIIECLEKVAHKCSPKNHLDITAFGSVTFRFIDDMCHH